MKFFLLFFSLFLNSCASYVATMYVLGEKDGILFSNDPMRTPGKKEKQGGILKLTYSVLVKNTTKAPVTFEKSGVLDVKGRELQGKCKDFKKKEGPFLLRFEDEARISCTFEIKRDDVLFHGAPVSIALFKIPYRKSSQVGELKFQLYVERADF